MKCINEVQKFARCWEQNGDTESCPPQILNNLVKRHHLVRKDMDVNEHGRLSHFTLRHKLK